MHNVRVESARTNRTTWYWFLAGLGCGLALWLGSSHRWDSGVLVLVAIVAAVAVLFALVLATSRLAWSATTFTAVKPPRRPRTVNLQRLKYVRVVPGGRNQPNACIVADRDGNRAAFPMSYFERRDEWTEVLRRAANDCGAPVSFVPDDQSVLWPAD